MIQAVLKVFVIVASSILLNAAALAQSEQASNGSMLSVTGSVTVIEGSVELLAAGPELLIESVQRSGELLVIVLKQSVESGRSSIKLSLKISGGVSLAAGQAVTVMSTAAGVLLSAAGAAIAWLPNELGQRLAYDETLTELQR